MWMCEPNERTQDGDGPNICKSCIGDKMAINYLVTINGH